MPSVTFLPAAAGAGSDPAVELAGGALDPAGARPRADEDRRPAGGGGPRAELRRRPRARPPTASSWSTSDSSRRRKRDAKVHAERGEVGGRRSRSDAEPQPPAGHEVRRQDPMREVHGVPERDLQDAGAAARSARHRGRHGERDERVGQEESAADRVEDPRAVEPGRLDAARPLGEALGSQDSRGRPPRADRRPLPSAGRVPSRISAPSSDRRSRRRRCRARRPLSCPSSRAAHRPLLRRG